MKATCVLCGYFIPCKCCHNFTSEAARSVIEERNELSVRVRVLEAKLKKKNIKLSLQYKENDKLKKQLAEADRLHKAIDGAYVDYAEDEAEFCAALEAYRKARGL